MDSHLELNNADQVLGSFPAVVTFTFLAMLPLFDKQIKTLTEARVAFLCYTQVCSCLTLKQTQIMRLGRCRLVPASCDSYDNSHISMQHLCRLKQQHDITGWPDDRVYEVVDASKTVDVLQELTIANFLYADRKLAYAMCRNTDSGYCSSPVVYIMSAASTHAMIGSWSGSFFLAHLCQEHCMQLQKVSNGSCLTHQTHQNKIVQSTHLAQISTS